MRVFLTQGAGATALTRLKDVTCGGGLIELVNEVVGVGVVTPGSSAHPVPGRAPPAAHVGGAGPRAVGNAPEQSSRPCLDTLAHRKTQMFLAAAASHTAKRIPPQKGQHEALQRIHGVFLEGLHVFESRQAINIAWALGKTYHPAAGVAFYNVVEQFVRRHGASQIHVLSLIALLNTAVKLHTELFPRRAEEHMSVESDAACGGSGDSLNPNAASRAAARDLIGGWGRGGRPPLELAPSAEYSRGVTAGAPAAAHADAPRAVGGSGGVSDATAVTEAPAANGCVTRDMLGTSLVALARTAEEWVARRHIDRILGSGELVALARCLAVIGCDEAVLATIIAKAAKELRGMPAGDRATLLWAIALRGSRVDLMMRLGTHISRTLLHDFREADFVKVLWAFATRRVVHEELLHEVCKYIRLTKLSVFSNKGIRSVCWALGVLQEERDRQERLGVRGAVPAAIHRDYPAAPEATAGAHAHATDSITLEWGPRGGDTKASAGSSSRPRQQHHGVAGGAAAEGGDAPEGAMESDAALSPVPSLREVASELIETRLIGRGGGGGGRSDGCPTRPVDAAPPDTLSSTTVSPSSRRQTLASIGMAVKSAVRLSTIKRDLLEQAVDAILAEKANGVGADEDTNAPGGRSGGGNTTALDMRVITDIVWSHHRARVAPTRLNDLLAARERELVGKELGIIMAAIAADGRVGHPVFEAVDTRVADRVDGLPIRDIAAVISAFAAAKYNHSAWYHVGGATTGTVRFTANDPQAATTELQHAGRALTALATVRVQRSPLYRCVVQRVLEAEAEALKVLAAHEGDTTAGTAADGTASTSRRHHRTATGGAGASPGAVPSAHLHSILEIAKALGEVKYPVDPILQHVNLRCMLGVVPFDMLPELLAVFAKHGWDNTAALARAAACGDEELGRYSTMELLQVAGVVVDAATRGSSEAPPPQMHPQLELFEKHIVKRIAPQERLAETTLKKFVRVLGHFKHAAYEGRHGMYHLLARRLAGAAHTLDIPTLLTALDVLEYMFIDPTPVFDTLAARHRPGRHPVPLVKKLLARVPVTHVLSGALASEAAKAGAAPARGVAKNETRAKVAAHALQ